MKKIFVIILAVLLTGAMSAKAMEYFRGTPAEIAQVQNDVLGFEAIDGNKVNTGGYFRENLLPLTNNLYDVGSSVLQFKDGYFAGTITATTANLGTLTASVALNTDEPLTIGNGTVSSTINGSSTSTFPYGATFATTGGNVGIGTASPAYRLDVSGGIRVTTGLYGTGDVIIGPNGTQSAYFDSSGAYINPGIRTDSGTAIAPILRDNLDSNTGIFFPAADIFGITTNGTERLRVDPSGFTSIGILGTSPYLLTLFNNATTTPLLAIGNGTATTTIAGGSPGTSTSTFSSDVSISNLYSGQLSLPVDSGWSSLIDIGVSGSAVTTTPQGYSFDVDGLPILKIFGSSDALGSVYNRRVEMTNGSGTATTTLQSPSNTATTTIYMGVKNSTAKGIGTCLVMTGDDGVRYYISVVGGVLTASTVSCENAGLGLSRD